MEEQRSLQVPSDGLIGMSSLGGTVVFAARSASTCIDIVAEMQLALEGKQMTVVFSEVSDHVHHTWSLVPFWSTKQVLNAMVSPTHLSNAGHYPSRQEAWEAKLQDHIGKQSSLADEAKSYQHFEVPGGINSRAWRFIQSQVLKKHAALEIATIACEQVPLIVSEGTHQNPQESCISSCVPPFILNDQDDAKKAQEQLRQLTACVKEAAKA